MMNIAIDYPELPENSGHGALLKTLQFHQLILEEALQEIAILREQNSQLRAKCKRLTTVICPVN
ncbi:hypothetical protein [Runella sp.]|uniref:hypothetical protein n=1 Tax=Runella sp. TaxID=1960881 RepID=UPI0030175B8E